MPHKDANRDGDHAHEDRGEPGRHAKGRQHEQEGDQRNERNQHAEPHVSGRVEDLLKHCDRPFACDAAILEARISGAPGCKQGLPCRNFKTVLFA